MSDQAHWARLMEEADNVPLYTYEVDEKLHDEYVILINNYDKLTHGELLRLREIEDLLY